MGKNIIYTYSCDNCKADFKSPDDVISVEGKLVNGEGEELFSDVLKNGDILCKKCLIGIINNSLICEIIEDIKDNVTIKKIEKPKEEFITLRRIETLKDEDTFIGHIGHLSRENFEKIYSKSLLGCYYPTDEEFNNMDFIQTCDENVIYKVFAGIPQIKTFKLYFGKDRSLAYANKSILLDEN